jgi:hypothetical protein
VVGRLVISDCWLAGEVNASKVQVARVCDFVVGTLKRGIFRQVNLELKAATEAHAVVSWLRERNEGDKDEVDGRRLLTEK